MMSTPESNTPPELPSGTNLWFRAALGCIALIAGLAAIGAWMREPAITLSRAFIDTLGGPGIFLGYLLPDAFPIPLPHELFTSMALLAGMDFWAACAWAFAGSISGACIGYTLGRTLHRIPPIARLLERHGRGVGHAIERYGPIALATAALTPLPFGLACWMCGAGHMPFLRFFAVCQIRIVRVVFYTWLVWAGIVTFVA